MPDPDEPAEWVSGRSALPWYIGLLIVFWVAEVVSQYALNIGFSWAGIPVDTPRSELLVQLLAIGFAIGPLFWWALAVPIPASRLGLTSEGLIFDYGLGSRFVPWDRTQLRTDRLEVLPRRFGPRTVYSLTPLQTKCIELIRSET